MPDEHGNYVSLTVAEAAARLGVTTEGVRARVKRGVYETQKGNDGRRRVLVLRSELLQTDSQQVSSGHEADGLRDLVEHELDRMADMLERARTDAEGWRAKAEAAAMDAVRAEAERKAAERVVDELRAMLADARRPWWRRLVGA